METVKAASHPPVVSLYGRTRELHSILLMLRSGTRIVTLRGPGGIGKTALACLVAHQVQGEYDDVFFVDLSAVREPQQVLGTVAATLPAPERLDTALSTLVRAVGGRRVLLILDNFEQVLGAAGDLLELLARADNLQLLVTSRAALGLHDESEYPLDPLPLPARGKPLEDSPAVALFVHRARAVQPEFALSDENARDVVALVKALEGVPLAIELAAARLRSFTLRDLRSRLDHPLAFLKADFRDRPERLRSLRAAVQWSYDLLSQEDREVLECCALFKGSFTPEALVVVWGGPDVLDRAEALLEQSFLQRVSGPATRWKMLQPLRELALEHLASSSRADAWRERHSRHYLSVLPQPGHGAPGTPEDVRERYLPDYLNMRAGLVWAINHQQAEVALRYLGGIHLIWVPFGYFQEGLQLCRRVLELPADQHRHLRPRALHTMMECLLPTGDTEAFTSCARELLEVSLEQGNVLQELYGHLGLAIGEHWRGHNAESVRTNQNLIRRCSELLALPPGKRPAAITDALLHQVCNNALNNATFGLLELGEHELALQYANDSLTKARQAGIATHLAQYDIVGNALCHLGRYREAAEAYLVSLKFALENEFPPLISVNARGLALVMKRVGRPELAVRFFGAGWRMGPAGAGRYMEALYDRATAELREQLGKESFESEWNAGQHLPLTALGEAAFAFARTLQTAPESAAQASSAVPETPVPAELTGRELEVLALLVQGHPDRRIAKLLNISPGTVSKHVGSMLGKLGLRNRVELARWAIERHMYE